MQPCDTSHGVGQKDGSGIPSMWTSLRRLARGNLPEPFLVKALYCGSLLAMSMRRRAVRPAAQVVLRQRSWSPAFRTWVLNGQFGRLPAQMGCVPEKGLETVGSIPTPNESTDNRPETYRKRFTNTRRGGGRQQVGRGRA